MKKSHVMLALVLAAVLAMIAGLTPAAGAQGLILPGTQDPDRLLLELRLREAQQRNLLLRQQLESIREAIQARGQRVPPVGSAPLVTPGAGALREQFRQRIVDEFLGVPVPVSEAPLEAFQAPPATGVAPAMTKPTLPPSSFAVPVEVPPRQESGVEKVPIVADPAPGTGMSGAAGGSFVPPPFAGATPPPVTTPPVTTPPAVTPPFGPFNITPDTIILQ